MEAITQKDIERINELYHKSQTAQGLTESERTEQQELRMAYIQAVRANLRGTLENIDIQNADGSITSLGKR
ncbi:MAG: DUF896 domain-containing protein [Lachnospiraceae bacterium]|nr:DUF896 domain-containing protein [Lachnospiraceae bacterium]